MSPAKHSYGSVTDRQTDRWTDDGQSYPYVSLYLAGDTKRHFSMCMYIYKYNVIHVYIMNIILNSFLNVLDNMPYHNYKLSVQVCT